MKGKNKLIIALFAVVAFVITSVAFALNGAIEKIKYATATPIEAFTAELEGGVIFSAERVYFAVDDDEDTTNDDEIRKTSLKYQGTQFNSIQTNNGTEYFIDYALRGAEGNDTTHKHVIDDGDFVMVDDNANYKAEDGANEFIIKQGIMITLGGYYFGEDNNANTNTMEWKDDDSDGDKEWVGVGAGSEVGANIDYVSAQAFLNGQAIELPNARGYDSSSHQDFTWFIVPSDDTEGRYEISFVYMKDGKELKYDFEFYLLLQSSYEKEVEVDYNVYTSKPTISNSEEPTENSYKFFSGTSLDYPMLTFDYARYDLSYTHVSGDVTTEVDFDYDEATQVLSLSQQVYSDVETEYYLIDTDPTNTIVSLMFVEHGKYTFRFDYIYKYEGTKITIPQEQIPFENLILDIHGYQLKYSKAGFASADMTYLEIYKNNTMFILVDGFINANNETTGDHLGVNYKLISKAGERTGTIKTNTSKTAGIITDKTEELTNWGVGDLNVNYQKTDRGLWLTLNDEYYLTSGNSPVVQESYYYYHPTKAIEYNFIKGLVGKKDDEIYAGEDTSRNRENFNKVTTFTAPGYYLVQVKYDYKPGSGVESDVQFFAFQITSATPKLELYKTKAESYSEQIEKDDFYAHEYTNQNVYANWAETEIFESTIVGKLYYSAGRYVAEADLKRVADGGFNSQITKIDYNKYDMIKNSASYLLVLEVERSATKTYTFFTIDKEPISGFEIYEVVTRLIDNRAIYSIKQDYNLNYISHTSKAVIDSSFTIDWADKNSGAKIDAKYELIPFVKNVTPFEGNNSILVESGKNTYNYIINEYGIGQKSNLISIQKPIQLNSILDINNVLTDQGIYKFELTDQAGNQLVYIIVVDRTEGVVNATYGEKQNPYVSGQMVADYVELEWGTHKAINLTNVNGVVGDLLGNNPKIEHYYEAGNNLNTLKNMFKSVLTESGTKNLFIVKNEYTEIKLLPRDKNLDYYILTSDGRKQIKHSNGITTTGWDDTANTLFENATNMGIKINVDKKAGHIYDFTVVGSNQVAYDSETKFIVRITPDKALGEIYSSSLDDGLYNNAVRSNGVETQYYADGSIKYDTYYEEQASDDGVFVFEWLPKSDQDKFEVIEVKYNYYQLMDQATLKDVTKSAYSYYPYKYVSTNYILQTEENKGSRIEVVSLYDKATRTIKDGEGNILQTKNVCQSNPINLAYETYYDENQKLVSKKVTQTGLYIITRTIAMLDEGTGNYETSEFSYAFFVDRNMIIGYSLTDIKQKVVGQFIHAAMPNSEGEVFYDNFNKQGLTPQKITIRDKNNKEITIPYEVYLETNKLPTKIQVPTGKYVSGSYNTDGSDKDIATIIATSYVNLNLRLSVYYKDSYGILPTPYKSTSIMLMDKAIGSEDDYIDFNFASFDEGALAVFKKARIHGEDGSLSLPGEYIFVISDTVGKVLKDFEVVDYNEAVFGVKLTNKAPQTDVYAYADINGTKSDNVYSDGYELYTNQEFVDFIIPVEKLKSYNAQLDIGGIEIWRSGLNANGKDLWLKLKNESGSLTADISGIEQDLSRVYWLDEKGKIITQSDTDAKDRLVKYLIKLDTGLEVVDNQIASFKEYVYIINIRYILKNSSTKYYEYKSVNDAGNTINNQFYQSTYTVTIDRTPNEINLNKLMSEQGEYFDDYHTWLAEQNGVERTDSVNKNYAYRSTNTVSDYYGLANTLYYQFAQNPGNLSNQAMYALTVDFDTVVDTTNLSEIYYREIQFNAANNRMGLLPITKTYFETTEYYTFNENSQAIYKKPKSEISHYWEVMEFKGTLDEIKKNYNNNYGRFYEIVEKDKAGNLTQYVIYFAPDEARQVAVEIVSKEKNADGTYKSANIRLTNNNSIEQGVFIGISDVTKLSGLADDQNPYYGNINIYNSSRQKIKTIYINSVSKHNEYDEDKKEIKEYGFEKEIYETIKEQGNYIFEYVNVFGQKFTAIVNNYTTVNTLNIAELTIKTDSLTGQSYITFSELNTMADETTSTYWYVKGVKVSYESNSKCVEYIAEAPKNGITELKLNSSEVDEVSLVAPDRLNLKKGIHYLVTVTDVAGRNYTVPLSTTDDYAYRLILPDNTYANSNVYYTANAVQISYNKEFYTANISVYETLEEESEQYKELDPDKNAYYTNTLQSASYNLIELKPDVVTDPANYYGSLRRFEVKLVLNGAAADSEQNLTYNIYIDTRITNFNIQNINKEDKIDYVKSTLKYDKDENKNYQDFNIWDLADRKYYTDLITETVNISWTRRTSNYFRYNYQLFEFVSADEFVEINTSGENSYSIAPKENTTGKYILKVTIEGKDNTWIATRVFGIFMSTTITGLYEVKDGDGNLYDYTSITNLKEITDSIGGNRTAMAIALGFVSNDGVTADFGDMNNAFESFGYKTAIPMYISNKPLTLHSNEDNGVSSEPYKPQGTAYSQITFYRVHRSNYQTFAVIMEVYPTDKNQNILSMLSFETREDEESESLLNNGTAKTIYNANAEFYRLRFSSYNRSASNPLERHNKIVIDVYYNNVFATRIKGGNDHTTPIEFENSGSYKLKIQDEAGNIQYFSNSSTHAEYFTAIVMKDMLYTINGEAPVKYAYYDKDVTLQINHYNKETNRNNYDINTIKVNVVLNSQAYTGYEHVAGSSTYVFKDYGTYLVTMSANLLDTGEPVKSQLVFTILNPNEARKALDFTSIYGYNIKSVHRIVEGGEPKDVTAQFIDLLQDKSNVGEVNVYNKLITYERLVEAFGTATQGKMKFRVLYEVKNDELLPAREVEFAFTLNNETASITSSIKPGGKTTDEVILKFNAANIYDQIGDCNLVINGEVVLRIDENSSNSITEIKVKEVGKYYIQLMGDSGNIAHSFNFTIKEPLNTVAIILIVVIAAIVIGLIATFIWLRTRMKVR